MNVRQLKADAARAVAKEPEAKRLVLIYTAILVGLSALVTVVNYCLELEIAQTGGLSNIGTRSVLSTIQTVLPLAQSLVQLCLELGFLNVILRIVRGQYVSPNSLRLGFDRFWPMLRLTLLEGLIYVGISMVSIYLAFQIFLFTPLSREALAIATEYAAGGGTALVLDEAVYLAMFDAMLPVFPIFGLIYLILLIPIHYRLRMTRYVLIDKPGIGALAAMRESRKMMKGNCRRLFLLDISLWWYYLLTVLASVVAYGDVLLPMVGVLLPWSDTVSYFLFYGMFLVMEFGIYYLFLNRVTAAYALSYEAMRPREAPAQGVVLGNIFQM